MACASERSHSAPPSHRADRAGGGRHCRGWMNLPPCLRPRRAETNIAARRAPWSLADLLGNRRSPGHGGVRGNRMADQREFKIGVLAGDGIGPEITDAAVEVLHAASERTGLKLRIVWSVGRPGSSKGLCFRRPRNRRFVLPTAGSWDRPSPANTRRVTTQTVIPAAIYAGHSSCSRTYVRYGHGRSWTGDTRP